jgi:uncharacterized protein (DUF58 family)
MLNLQELPFSPSKDLESLGFFRSSLLRWVWKIYTQRLTRAGRWFIWPSAVVVALGSMSLQVQTYVALAYVFGLWAVAFIAMLLFRPRVKLTAHLADRVCAGEALTVDIELEYTGPFGAMDVLVLPHRLPAAVDADPDDGAVVRTLAPGQKARVSLALRCNHRGIYPFHGFRVESDFPFGLLLASRKFEQQRTLTVYPKFTRLARLELPSGRRYHPGGVALASSLGESFEYIGNREYRDGDSLRDIDWRATARLCLPIVREYRDEYFMRVAVILDTHVPARAKQPAHDAFERAVSVSAAISDYMARQDYLVDIFAAGPNLYHLTAGRSLAYLDQILDILACVEENPDEPFAIIEPQLMEYLSRITTVICVFLDWNDTRRDFIHRLNMQGAGVKVLIVRDSECTLDPAADVDLLGAVPIISQARFNAGIGEL